MAVITARILQSSGLASAVGSIQAKELGLTLDTERPVVGSTVGGPKYIQTEEALSITTAAPTAVPIIRRSDVSIIVDTNSAGANVALDIRAGAQVAGYAVTVVVFGSADRYCACQYKSGVVEYIPIGQARRFVYTGVEWQLLKMGDGPALGSIVPLPFLRSVSATFPYVLRTADKDLPLANYPVLVPALLAEKANSLGVTDYAVTVAGSVVTFPSNSASDALLKALKEDAIVSKYLNTGEPASFLGGEDYTTAASQLSVNVAGVTYAITNIDLVTRNVTVSGTPASGAQTAYVCPYAIAGSTAARLRKITGFIPAPAGDAGGEEIAGLRRMDRGQGHWHENWTVFSGGGASSRSWTPSNTSTYYPMARSSTDEQVRSPVSDTANGTPRTGKTTDPRMASMWFYTYAQIYGA